MRVDEGVWLAVHVCSFLILRPPMLVMTTIHEISGIASVIHVQ